MACNSTAKPWWLLSQLSQSILSSFSTGFTLFTFWLSWVSPGAVEVCVATPLSDGLHLTPERVQAEFVGVLLLFLLLGGWLLCAVCLLSGCLVLRARPGLHAHLGGAGISGADIDTRKEITRAHANQLRRHTKTHTNTGGMVEIKALRGGWISRGSPERRRDKRSGMEGGPEWRERWRAWTQRGVSIVLAKMWPGGTVP